MRYTTVQGDMWDSIAHKVYNNENRMDILLKANPEYCYVYVFSAGIELEIPEIEEKKAADTLPVWKNADG